MTLQKITAIRYVLNGQETEIRLACNHVMRAGIEAFSVFSQGDKILCNNCPLPKAQNRDIGSKNGTDPDTF